MPFLTFHVPKHIAPMAVGGNKNALIREVGADGKREWSYDLVDTNCPCNLCVYTHMYLQEPLWCTDPWCPTQSSWPASAPASFLVRPSSVSAIWRSVASLSLMALISSMARTASSAADLPVAFGCACRYVLL